MDGEVLKDTLEGGETDCIQVTSTSSNKVDRTQHIDGRFKKEFLIIWEERSPRGLVTGPVSELYPSLIMCNSHSEDPFVLRIEERRLQEYSKSKGFIIKYLQDNKIPSAWYMMRSGKS